MVHAKAWAVTTYLYIGFPRTFANDVEHTVPRFLLLNECSFGTREIKVAPDRRI